MLGVQPGACGAGSTQHPSLDAAQAAQGTDGLCEFCRIFTFNFCLSVNKRQFLCLSLRYATSGSAILPLHAPKPHPAPSQVLLHLVRYVQALTGLLLCAALG